MINVFQPTLGNREIDALRAVIESNWLGPGPRVETFVRSFAKHLDTSAKGLTALTSCTECLFQSLAALDLQPDDQVVLPTISFIGAAHAIRATGARIILSDVDPVSLNPTEEHIGACITDRTKAILILHYGGHPGSVREIANLASEKKILLIEDAACAIGSSVGNRMVGTFGEIGMWSFDPMKILVAGDGGVVRTSSPDVAERIRLSSFLGIRAGGYALSKDRQRWWEVEPEGLGRRTVMNDLTAAIGLTQLQRLDSFIRRRTDIATCYEHGLADLDWIRTPPPPRLNSTTSWYFYWVQVAQKDRNRLAYYLLENNIYTTFRYWPLHKTEMYRRSGTHYPGAEVASDTTLLLPMHQGLSDDDVDRVVKTVREFRPSVSTKRS
ncbi:MAG: DegT/DnrJ/EryC1/StrS family aminotransferase [Proteobacteria bacterium]|nr:DegT/DnrJ/EryC1/StrS family aminotransferase [Pseudomonadota bacterium]